ncbi:MULTISPECIES: hypothetical protein [unclassified Micromonospora]|uniref:hypothetical protein n=1 Tax=unclassified Micromonospora TaxID=2617518 RepID=UPI003644F2ED
MSNGPVTDQPTVATAPPADQPATARKLARRRRRRAAKALLYVSLILTALLVLAEPWLLVPVATAAVALSLWK